tara:strand:+ start:620 stop:796 length:177 start_codon:yes stop_codon:yes gene_type:complete
MLIEITHPSVYVCGKHVTGLTEVEDALGKKLIDQGKAVEGIEEAELVVNPEKKKTAKK